MQRKDKRWFSLHCLTGKPAIKCAGREGRRKEREDTKTNPSVFGWVCVIMEILSEVIYKVLWVFKTQSAKPQDGSPQGHPGFLSRNSHGLWSGRPSQPHMFCVKPGGSPPSWTDCEQDWPSCDRHSLWHWQAAGGPVGSLGNVFIHKQAPVAGDVEESSRKDAWASIFWPFHLFFRISVYKISRFHVQKGRIAIIQNNVFWLV